MLILRVLPIMSVYRLPYGQYGYSGHILNLPQDITSFINSLPRCPATLDLVIVRREGSTTSHRDFKVRRSVVLRALIEHNMYYSDVTIDHHILSQLPDYSDISDHFVTAVKSRAGPCAT